MDDTRNELQNLLRDSEHLKMESERLDQKGKDIAADVRKLLKYPDQPALEGDEQ